MGLRWRICTKVLLSAIVVSAVVLAYAAYTTKTANAVLVDSKASEYKKRTDTLREAHAQTIGRSGTKSLVVSRGSLMPGESTGRNPQFTNVGRSKGTIHEGNPGEYFITGKMRIIYYTRGNMKKVAVVENRRFVCTPPDPR